MSLDYDDHYQQLLAALAACQEKSTTEIEKVEGSFKCSLDHWGKIQKLIRAHDFPTSAEEIRFFKKIKPRFTAYIEFYTCRYHALLFMPSDDNLELVRFWKWEMRKTEKFFENNEDFCRYMQEDATGKDEDYFLRASNNGVQVMHGRIHDVDPQTATPGDYLVTTIGAYEMYQTFIRGEMKKLGGYFFLTK
jgi:hypothetical protein